VKDNNNVLMKHVVKAEKHYCSCLEWQHTGKPSQHGLVVIIAQPFRDVGMEYFVDKYFSIDKFKKAYARRLDPLGDRSFWPQVSIAMEVGASISKRPVERQRKNRVKGCLEVGGNSKKPSSSEKDKTNIHGKFKYPNCQELGHRKNSRKCPLNGTKKRQVTNL
jgi:hypothetical protein